MNRTMKYKRKRKARTLSALIVLAVICSLVFAVAVKKGMFYAGGNKDGNSSAASTAPGGKIEPSTGANDANRAEPTKERNEDEKPKEITLSPDALPEKFKGFSWEVLQDGQIIKDYRPENSISFPNAGEYSSLPGITCFRGNNYRNAPSFGYADIKEEKLEKVWFSKTGYIDIWTGVGWTGQPAIVKWDPDLRSKMNLLPEKKRKDSLLEVIYATLDGKVYFLDLEDGKRTRNPLDIGYTHKGSVVIDPRGYPLLYAGQGIPEKNGKKVPIGYRIYSLTDYKLLYFLNGYDPDAFRRWGAFDSGGLVDARTDTLIECGENGILYSIKLNTMYDREKASVSIKPELTKYRYRSPYGTKIGTENSPAIYKNLIYFADNSGFLQCVDLNTLKPVWARNVTDDTDGTPVLEEAGDSEVYLYTACEVDRQGKDGVSYIRKINALSGELIWEKSVQAAFDPNTNGGAMATPVIGKHDIGNLIIFNIARTGKNKNGSKLMAIDKTTGKETWMVDLQYYCWSSPVDIYTEAGRSYLLVCDSGGYMRLLEGKSGRELDRVPLEANIEGSPAVYGNMAVIGTRGQKIWGIRIN